MYVLPYVERIGDIQLAFSFIDVSIFLTSILTFGSIYILFFFAIRTRTAFKQSDHISRTSFWVSLLSLLTLSAFCLVQFVYVASRMKRCQTSESAESDGTTRQYNCTPTVQPFGSPERLLMARTITEVTLVALSDYLILKRFKGIFRKPRWGTLFILIVLNQIMGSVVAFHHRTSISSTLSACSAFLNFMLLGRIALKLRQWRVMLKGPIAVDSESERGRVNKISLNAAHMEFGWAFWICIHQVLYSTFTFMVTSGLAGEGLVDSFPAIQHGFYLTMGIQPALTYIFVHIRILLEQGQHRVNDTPEPAGPTFLVAASETLVACDSSQEAEAKESDETEALLAEEKEIKGENLV